MKFFWPFASIRGAIPFSAGILFAGIAFTGIEADSTAALPLAPGLNEFDLAGRLAELPGVRESVPFEALKRRPETEWRTLRGDTVNYGYSNRFHYFRLALKNEGSNPLWYLSVRNNRLDLTEFHLETENGIQRHRSGDTLVWTGNEPAAFPVFRFTLNPGENGVIYFRVRSTAHLAFRVSLQSGEAFGRARGTERLFVIAVGLIMFLLAAFQFYLNPLENVSIPIYFALALLFGGLFYWVRFGNGALYLYPGSLYLKHNGVFLLVVPTEIFLILFFYKFLEIRSLSPRVDTLLLWSAICLGLSYPLYWLDLPLATKNQVWVLSLFAVMAVILASFIVAVRGRRKWALVLFIAWIACHLAVIAQIMMIFKLLPHHPVIVYGIVMTVPVWFLILMVTTARRYAALRRERDDYLERMVNLLRQESGPVADTPDLPESAATAANSQREKRVRSLDTETLMEGLMRLVKEERLYLSDEISMEDFAVRLGIRPDQLSALLNMRMGVSFSRLINQHRIDEACRLLRDRPYLNVLRIALDCGFGSKSTFNREFKRHTGMTPAAYRARDSAG